MTERFREFYAIPETLVIPYTKIEGRTFEGKPMIRRPLVIQNHLIRLDSQKEEDKVKIELLETCKANTKNGGHTLFEVDQKTKEESGLSRGESLAFEPQDGVTEGDKKSLEYLNGLGPNLPPNTIKKAVPMALSIFDRFRIKNVARPKETMKPKVVRAILIAMIDAIEEAGLWNGNSDTEGQTITGEGAQENQG